MTEQEKKDIKEAIDVILSITPKLKYYQWLQICQHVQMAYNSKTTKVMLDGSDVDNIRQNFRRDYL